MTETAWFRQRIPPELFRREARSSAAITILFASIFPVSFLLVGLFQGRFEFGLFFWAMAVIVPAGLALFMFAVTRSTRYADLREVGISEAGVALRFADREPVDLGWGSLDDVECFSKEAFHGLFDPCSLRYTDAHGKTASVLLLKEPGRLIQRELWRRSFREQRKPPEPVARPGFSESDYAPPAWAEDGLTMSYREGDDRLWYRVAGRGSEVTLLDRVDWSPGFIKEEKEWYDTLYEDPAAFEIWMEVEREWTETPFRSWQESRYGEMCVNARRTPEAQWVLDRPATFVERGSCTFHGARHRALRFDTATETECHCTWLPKLPPDSLLLAMFTRGVGRKLRPGTCPTCQGGLLERRSCQDCRGTGKHAKCKGTGTDRYETRNWYEERTGILLRWETWREGKLVGTRELESLEPDILRP